MSLPLLRVARGPSQLGRSFDANICARIRCKNGSNECRISDFSNLPELDLFTVMHNGLSGQLPALHDLPKLARLVVGINQLTGPLPPLKQLSQLEALSVESNHFTGQLPAPPTSLKIAHICPNAFETKPHAGDEAWEALLQRKPWWGQTRCGQITGTASR